MTARIPLRSIASLVTVAFLGLAGTALPAHASITVSSHPPTRAFEVADTSGTTYYVDASSGDDTDSGDSESAPWRTLDKVNETTFEPGDQILLKAGESWTGQLWPKGSGSADQPISIGAYAAGDKPVVEGAGEVDDAVRLFNQEHWVISDLDVSNRTTDASPTGEDLKDLRGIHISGDNGQTLSGITVSRVDVHDVTGTVNWISGNIAGNKPGISFKNGWDGSKKTGGIVIDTTVQDIENPQETPTIIDNVVIEDSSVINTSFAGIIVKQYTGDGTDGQGNTIATKTGWGTRDTPNDPKFAPHTDITIRGNYIYQDGTEFGCNGIYLTNVRGALVEKNVVERAGTSGIETYYADDVVIQHNEVYDTQKKAGGADSNGIDPDKATTNQLIQYNYLHGNGDGILLCQFLFGDAIVRNNVITHSSRYPIYLHSDSATVAEIYNNTIYNDTASNLIYGYGSYLKGTYTIRNNVLHSERAFATLSTSPTITYENNLYSGAELTIPQSDTSALVGDALFVDPDVTGPFGTPETGPQLDTAHAFATLAGSKAVNTGSVIEGSSDIDYTGAPRPVGNPDIGAFEYRTPEGATTEVLSGFTRAGNGRPLAEVEVNAEVGGTVHTATSDAAGWFRITDVPLGDVTVSASRVGYESAPVTTILGEGTSGLVDLELASTSDVGSVSGQVLTVTGAPLMNATVEVLSEGSSLASATSDSQGHYLVEDVAIGEGYTVRAHSADLRSAEVTGVRVDPAAETPVTVLILQPAQPTVIFEDDVEAREQGALATGTDGYTISSSGGSVDVVDTGGDQAVRITRTANSGSTSLKRVFDEPLTGIVTVEASIMREDGNASRNWFGLPYLSGTTGNVSTAVAFSSGNIVGYQGTSSSTLMPYEQGRWYTVTTVVDTVNQRFDLLVDGEQLIDDATFRAPMIDGIAQIEFYANSSNTGVVHVDNLRVLQGSERYRGDAGIFSVTTDAGTPVLDAGRWKLAVPAATEQLSVTVVPSAAEAQALSIAGEPVTPGSASSPVPLSEGTNEIEIAVTAENGTTRVHILEIERGSLASDATLSGLAFDEGTLAPAFSGDVDVYDLTLEAGIEEIGLTATALAPETEIVVDGVAVASGELTRTAVPADGTITIQTSSSDGTSALTYTVTIVQDAEAVETWDAEVTYDVHDAVVYDGSSWIASWWTQGQTPGDPTGPWQEVVTAPDGSAVWTPSRIFNAGDVVIHEGHTFTAQWWTRAQNPDQSKGQGPWAG